MRKAALKITAVLLAALLLGGTPPVCAEGAPVCVAMDDGEWTGIDCTYCGFAGKSELLDKAAEYAAAIAALTGREDWTDFYGTGGVTIEIAFTNTASHVEGGYESYLKKIPKLYINRSMAEYNFWPLAHELTHLICPDYSSLSLREGLACYMQDEVAGIPAVFNYGLDAHVYAYLYVLEDNREVLGLMGSADLSACAAVANGKQRAAFYLCSYSFSRYLIETYGMERFMALYESGNIQKTCRLTFGRDLERLVDDWTQYLYDYPAKMTRAEIEQYLSDIMALHGVSAGP